MKDKTALEAGQLWSEQDPLCPAGSLWAAYILAQPRTWAWRKPYTQRCILHSVTLLISLVTQRLEVTARIHCFTSAQNRLLRICGDISTRQRKLLLCGIRWASWRKRSVSKAPRFLLPKERHQIWNTYELFWQKSEYLIKQDNFLWHSSDKVVHTPTQNPI